jgi:hypothetical protein
MPMSNKLPLLHPMSPPVFFSLTIGLLVAIEYTDVPRSPKHTDLQPSY